VEDLEQEDDGELLPDDFTGEIRQVLTTQRIKQHFFRRAVLSSYGAVLYVWLIEVRLLVASHIVPWSKDKANRLNQVMACAFRQLWALLPGFQRDM